MATGKSSWQHGTLADITAIKDVLDSLDGLLQPISSGIETLTGILEAIISIVEIVSTIVSAVEDIQKTAMDLAIAQLEAAKNAIIKLLRNLFDFGLYVLPMLDSFDLPMAIRNELLNPGFTSNAESIRENQDQVIRVPNPENPSDSYLKIVRKTGRVARMDYPKFIEDIINSFDDTNDILKPSFTPGTKTHGVIIAAAAERIGIFVIAYILIDLLLYGKNASYGKMEALEKIINISIGESESLGRSQNDDAKRDLLNIAVAIKETLEKNTVDSLSDIIFRFLNLLGIHPEEDATLISDGFKILSTKIKGPSQSGLLATPTNNSGYSYVLDDLSAVPFLTPTTITAGDIANYNNVAEINITTSGAGALVATYSSNGISYNQLIGEGKNEWTVGVPLTSVGDAITINGISYDAKSSATLPYGNEFGLLFAINPIDNLYHPYVFTNISEEYRSATSVTFKYLTLKDSVDDYFNSTPEYTWTYSIPKFSRYVMNSAKRQITFGDSFLQDISVKLSPSTSEQYQMISNYSGYSRSDVENQFPVDVSMSTDLTRFGPGLSDANIELVVTPAVSILGNFDGRLYVNGAFYEYKEKIVGLRTAKFTYENIPLGSASSGTMFFVSNQEQQTYDTLNGVYENYMAYSVPRFVTYLKSGGLLSAPIIKSGAKINASTNAFSMDKGTEGTGLPATAGYNQFENRINKFNDIYSVPDIGSKPAENISINAVYRLSGKKSIDCYVYAVVTDVDNPNNVSIEGIGNSNVIGGSLVIPTLPVVSHIVGDINLGGNTFSKDIILKWNGKEQTKYSIRVYQTRDKIQYFKAINAAGAVTNNKEAALLAELGGNHDSMPGTKIVTVTNLPNALNSNPPDWMNFSLGAFFPIVDQIDEQLSELIDILKDSVPAGPYDGIRDWLKLIERKIKAWINILKKIKDIIDNINSLLQIGGTGFYFLGIANANGVDGFKERLQKVPINETLAKCKYVSGIVLFVPDSLEDPITGLSVKIGNTLMNDVFSKLPSSGEDTVIVPENKTLLQTWLDQSAAANSVFDSKNKEIAESRQRIDKISGSNAAARAKKAEDIR
jgi:hypothetical protein